MQPVNPTNPTADVPSWVWIVSLSVICLVLLILIGFIGVKAKNHKGSEELVQQDVIYAEDRNSLLGTAAGFSGNALNESFDGAKKSNPSFADGQPIDEIRA